MFRKLLLIGFIFLLLIGCQTNPSWNPEKTITNLYTSVFEGNLENIYGNRL